MFALKAPFWGFFCFQYPFGFRLTMTYEIEFCKNIVLEVRFFLRIPAVPHVEWKICDNSQGTAGCLHYIN